MEEIKETETTKTETTKAIKKETIEDFIKNPDFLKPYRLNNEPDLHYEIRRKLNKFYLKEKKRRLVWLSKDISKESKGFTYNKEQVRKALENYKLKATDKL